MALKEKLENYWYHYKWRTIIAVFLLLVITVSVVQCATREDTDICIMYLGPLNIARVEEPQIRAAVKQVLREDLQKENYTVTILDILYTNDKIAERYRQEGLYFDPATNGDAVSRFDTEVIAGDSIIFMVDRQQYTVAKQNGAFVKLSEILDKVPDYAIDEYGIRLKDTDFGKYFPCFADFDEDIILCAKAKSDVSFFFLRKKNEDLYERHYKVFADIIAFKMPEE